MNVKEKEWFPKIRSVRILCRLNYLNVYISVAIIAEVTDSIEAGLEQGLGRMLINRNVFN